MFHPLILCTLIGVVSAGMQISMRESCNLPMERGTDCNNNGTMRFYMDKDRLQCYPFKYNGCGGNENNFESAGECTRCLPADLNFCPGNTNPSRREDGTSHCNHMIECPENSSCRAGFAVGLCCSNESIKKSQSDDKPSCPNGKEVVRMDKYGFPMIHTGKSCEHEFCPRGSSCHQGEYIAYCCQ